MAPGRVTQSQIIRTGEHRRAITGVTNGGRSDNSLRSCDGGRRQNRRKGRKPEGKRSMLDTPPGLGSKNRRPRTRGAGGGNYFSFRRARIATSLPFHEDGTGRNVKYMYIYDPNPWELTPPPNLGGPEIWGGPFFPIPRSSRIKLGGGSVLRVFRFPVFSDRPPFPRGPEAGRGNRAGGRGCLPTPPFSRFPETGGQIGGQFSGFPVSGFFRLPLLFPNPRRRQRNWG